MVSIHVRRSGRGIPRSAALVRRVRGDARDSSSQLAQVGGDIPELVRGAFELTQCARLIRGRLGNVLRPGAIPTRDLCDARDAFTEPSYLGLLHA